MENESKTISKEMLNDLGVYELRELARTLGVVSPTTKKRAQLCTEILEISSGKRKIETKQTNKGRPPKTITKISNIVKETIPEEVLSLRKPIEQENYSNILRLAQNTTLFNQISGEDASKVYGYLNSVNGNFYLNNLSTTGNFKSMLFYVTKDVASKYNLREGDKVLGVGKLADAYYCGILSDVLEINGKDAQIYLQSRNNFDISNFEIPSKLTDIFGRIVKLGERTITFFGDEENAILQIVKEIEDFSQNPHFKEKLVFLGLELSPEVIYYGKQNKNLEMFATTYYNNLDESYGAVVNAINHCASLLKDGKSVRIFVFDVVGILTRLDQYFASEEGQYMGHKISSVQLVKKLVGIGKAISSDLTITSHAIAFENQKEDEFVKSELLKIAKVVEQKK